MIGVIILNYNTWEKTIECVHSMLDSYKGEKEIVIVDNNSPNDSFERLIAYFAKEEHSEIHIIRTPDNGGFSKGNNFGFRYIRQNFHNIQNIVITNNDILFTEHSVEKLISTLNSHKDAVVSAPMIFNPQHEKMSKPWKCKPSLYKMLFGFDQACMYSWDELKIETEVYLVSGCCFAVNADFFEQIGMFDEEVFLYNEENILSYKIKNSGYKVYFNPDSKVIHDHGSSTGNSNIFVDKENFKSSVYFWRKYVGKRKLDLWLMWIYWLTKTNVKIILHRYSKVQGYWKAIKETFYSVSSVN